MVGHDRPRMQAIALTIEREKRILDESGDWLAFQPARTPTAIEHFVTQSFRPVGHSQTFESLFWETIGKPKSDKLDDVLGVEVRQIVTRMPALVLHEL